MSLLEIHALLVCFPKLNMNPHWFGHQYNFWNPLTVFILEAVSILYLHKTGHILITVEGVFVVLCCYMMDHGETLCYSFYVVCVWKFPNKVFVKTHCTYTWLIFRQTPKNGVTQGNITVSQMLLVTSGDVSQGPHLFIYLFNRYLFIYFMPDSVLGTGNTTGNKVEKAPISMALITIRSSRENL